MPLVSVVVPVYNTGKYIKRCVNSILAQAFNDYEIILINDGSTDNSLEICTELSKNDTRILVISKENNGVSSARNDGINIAKGKYICFIDSDDAISTNYLDLLIENIKGADLSIGAYSLIEGSCTTDCSLKTAQYSLLDFKKSFLTTFTSAYINCPCNKLFSLKIIKTHNIEFPVGMFMGEDSIFVTRYIDFCKRINVFSEVIYYYYRMPGKYKTQFLSDRLIMIKNYASFYKEVNHYALRILILREYLSAIQADIQHRDDIANVEMYFASFIKENRLDAYISNIKVPFIKNILAYQWLTLLKKRKYKEYLEKYAGVTL